jgi:putative membrane protein
LAGVKPHWEEKIKETQKETSMDGLANRVSAVFLQMWNGEHMGGDWGWAGWFTMSLVMVLFWGTIAAFAIYAMRSMSDRTHPSSGPSALDIARQRYARGEITDEEFERIKRGLA